MLRSVFVLTLIALASPVMAMSQMDLPPGYPPPSSYVDGAIIGLVASAFTLVAGGWLRAPNSVRSLPWAVGCMLLMTTACLAASDGTEPDPVLTPGSVETQDIDIICHHKTGERRVAKAAEKASVYRAYHLASRHSGFCAGRVGCDLDDRVPLECGGRNDAANLWPQRGSGPYNQTLKNRLEGLCHRLVCAGTITPAEGQAWFLGDWKAEYDKRFGSPPQHQGELVR